MRVLITGSTGFIGRALVAYLLAKKQHEVFAFVRKSSKRSLIPQGAEIVEGDLFSFDSLKSALERVEVVIHLASNVDFYPKKTEDLYKINVEGTRNLVRASEAAGIRRFIYISSTEVCAPTGNEIANEDTPMSANFDYGQSKILAEQEVIEGCELTSMEYTIIRPTGVIGPGNFSSSGQLFWAVNFGFFFFLPNTSGKVCFTHLSDIVKGIEISIEKKEARNEIIILTSNPLSYNDVIKVSAKELGRMEPIVTLPFPLVRMVVVILKPFLSNLFDKKFLFEPKTFDQMNLNRCYSNKKAKKILGWTPQYTFEEAIRETISVQLQTGELKKRSYSMFFIIILTIFIVILAIIINQLIEDHPANY